MPWTWRFEKADGTPIGLPLPTNNLAFGVEAVYTIGIPFGIQQYMPFEVQYAGPAPTLAAGVSRTRSELGGWF